MQGHIPSIQRAVPENSLFLAITAIPTIRLSSEAPLTTKTGRRLPLIDLVEARRPEPTPFALTA